MPDETEPTPIRRRNQPPAVALYSQGEKIDKINVADEIKNSFLDYSMSVIISRALPDVRDGLKPSQRRILYAMEKLSLFPGRKHIKCAKICGDTSGNYHPHGEAVIYPTLVHMAQPWAMREKLVDGKGNFGSVENDPPAAMRYTEARLTHLGARADVGHGQGHGGFRPELRRADDRADGFPGRVSEPARQWRHGHRRRHGHEHGRRTIWAKSWTASARRLTSRTSRFRN